MIVRFEVAIPDPRSGHRRVRPVGQEKGQLRLSALALCQERVQMQLLLLRACAHLAC
jgi:hypothetical protein